MKRLILAAFVMWLTALPAFAQTTIEELEKSYFASLDQWVIAGGHVEKVQEDVVGNCGKLVTLKASAGEKIAFITTDREEFDFRVDVCVKMTVNRVHHQPEFDNQKIVKTICDGDNNFFKLLCKRSGLR